MQSLILNVATNSIFFNKYIIRQIHNRLHSARGCRLVLREEGTWYPRLSLTSETSSKPPGIIGFPQTEGQTEGGRKTRHRDCSWGSLEGLLVTHIGSRAPVSHMQLSEVPGGWHLLSSHLPARGLKCHGTQVPPCMRLHSPGSVPTSRLSSGWPHHSHKNWVIEIILYTNLRDWMYKACQGIDGFWHSLSGCSNSDEKQIILAIRWRRKCHWESAASKCRWRSLERPWWQRNSTHYNKVVTSVD